MIQAGIRKFVLATAAIALIAIALPGATASAAETDNVVGARPLGVIDVEIGGDGNPIIAYIDWVFRMHVTTCADPTCTQSTTTALVYNSVGFPPVNALDLDMEIGSSGNPTIAFTARTVQDNAVIELRVGGMLKPQLQRDKPASSPNLDSVRHRGQHLAVHGTR